MIHIKLNTIFCTQIQHSPTKNNLRKVLYGNTHTRMHTHTHTQRRTDCSRNCEWKYYEKRKLFSLALKDDRVEQCLKSCGSEFQMWGPKQEKVQKP